jgi:hypothetical protein
MPPATAPLSRRARLHAFAWSCAFVLAAACFASGCSESSFSGGGDGAAEPTPSAEPSASSTPSVSKGEDASAAAAPPSTDASANAGQQCHTDGDVVKIDVPGEIKTCVDKKKLWNFDGSGCSAVAVAQSYDCSFKGLAAAVKAQGFSDQPVLDAKSKGAKLIACGEKTNVVVAQWFFPGELDKAADCSFTQSPSLVVTACFRRIEVTSPTAGGIRTSNDPEEAKKCLSGS